MECAAAMRCRHFLAQPLALERLEPVPGLNHSVQGMRRYAPEEDCAQFTIATWKPAALSFSRSFLRG